jgi:hypothetical protein
LVCQARRTKFYSSTKEREYGRPGKIAILDSGISKDHDPKGQWVKGKREFVAPEDEECLDNTGHGTCAVQLILRVYNKAELYVGKVFNSSQATNGTPALMAEALHHARATWEVGIIIMPSGFTSRHRELEKAVVEAHDAGMLIFAPPANHGILDEVAFPGRMYRNLKLLCMFSTDPNVRAFPNFNPSPGSVANSFAILGEDVTLPWQYHGSRQMAKSGTSHATMIGAAIAGRILDFSRHKDIRAKMREVHMLRTVEGMSAV